eukprot:scaffold9607_cov113-Isochrysis_galbana.AAC.6
MNACRWLGGTCAMPAAACRDLVGANKVRAACATVHLTGGGRGGARCGPQHCWVGAISSSRSGAPSCFGNIASMCGPIFSSSAA